MKRILATVMTVVGLTAMCFAEDAAAAPAPAAVLAPKIGIEFTQQIDTEAVNTTVGQASGGKTFGTDAIYSKTELKGTATYDLGGGLTVAPAFKNGLESFFDNPSATPYLLTGVRYRNRFNPSLTVQKKFIPEFTLAVAGDYRLGNDISTTATSSSTNKPVENRLGGVVTGSGKVAIVTYSVAQSVFFYTDVLPDNNKDDGYLELDGTYAVGTAFKLNDAYSLKFDLSDRFVYDFLSASDATNSAKYAQITSNGVFKVSLANPDFTPYAALLVTNCVNNAGGNQVNFIGGSFGGDLTKGNYIVGAKYDIGVNSKRESAKGVSAGKDQTESHFSAYFKVKI